MEAQATPAGQVVDRRAGAAAALEALRSFRMAAWLGWQIESNWTDPFLFAVYSVIKPVAGAAILVVMYAVITRGDFESPLFSYILLGNAFYIYVGQIMSGISWAVIEDREHYRTMKYLYIAPIRISYCAMRRWPPAKSRCIRNIGSLRTSPRPDRAAFAAIASPAAWTSCGTSPPRFSTIGIS